MWYTSWNIISTCLFGHYEYLKVKHSEHVISFAFKHNSKYHKFIIACHPDSCFNNQSEITYSQYYSFGNWYYYDGNSKKLYEQLKVFNPTPKNLSLLVGILQAECNLTKYKSTCAIIGEWVQYVVSIVPKAVGFWLFDLLLGGGNDKKLIESREDSDKARNLLLV